MNATTGARVEGRATAPGVAPSVTSPSAPRAGRWPAGLDEAHEPTRLVDFLLGSVVLVAVGIPGLSATFGVGLLAIAALAALATVRRPTRSFSGIGWLPALAVLVLVYLVLVSFSSPDLSLYGWPKRALRLALLLMFLLAMVAGRVHVPSLIRGAAVGLLANVALFYAGLTPARYGDLLTGLLLDKNQAGLSYTVIGLLALGVMNRRRDRILIVAVASASVWATGSRTSLAALAFGLLWYVARTHLNLPYRMVTLALMVVTIPFIEDNYARVGAFAARVGSDQFRARIDEFAATKLESAPIQGLGLGEAWVQFPNGDVFFFHNSYWSALVEGGWPYVLVLVAAHVLVGVRPLSVERPPSRFALAGECANIAVLVCALRLGEVFATTTGMLALAAGAVGWLQVRQVRADGTHRDEGRAKSAPTPVGTVAR